MSHQEFGESYLQKVFEASFRRILLKQKVEAQKQEFGASEAME